jgi:hypothetical protein
VPNSKRTRDLFERPDYYKSVWATMLQQGHCKNKNRREYKIFRRRFGVSYPTFEGICREAGDWLIDPKDEGKRLENPNGVYRTFGSVSKGADATGRKSVPLELKILGCLRMLAKGVAFDAIAELSGMSISTMQAFYHLFWQRFVEKKRAAWIKHPRNPEEAAVVLEVYRLLGFPGACGSVDCTHIYWGRCPAQLANIYTGKEKKATVSYQF